MTNKQAAVELAITAIKLWEVNFGYKGDINVSSQQAFGAIMAQHHKIILQALEALRQAGTPTCKEYLQVQSEEASTVK